MWKWIKEYFMSHEKLIRTKWNVLIPLIIFSLLPVIASAQLVVNPASGSSVGGSGTVTSVAMTVPAILTVTGSPITTSGTLAVDTAVAPTGTGSIVLNTQPTFNGANATVNWVSAVASDTTFWTGVKSDAGGDEDDGWWIGTGTTPGAGNVFVQGSSTRSGGTSLGGLSNTNSTNIAAFVTSFTSLSSWTGVCIRDTAAPTGGSPGVSSCGSSNKILDLRGQDNGAGSNFLTITDSSTGIWAFRNTGAFIPQSDKTYDVGLTTLGVKNLFAYHYIASDTGAPAIAGNATLNTGSADSAGKITATATSASTAVITFNFAFARAPACYANNETTAVLITTTTTTTTITFNGAFVSGDVVSYHCMGF